MDDERRRRTQVITLGRTPYWLLPIAPEVATLLKRISGVTKNHYFIPKRHFSVRSNRKQFLYLISNNRFKYRISLLNSYDIWAFGSGSWNLIYADHNSPVEQPISILFMRDGCMYFFCYSMIDSVISRTWSISAVTMWNGSREKTLNLVCLCVRVYTYIIADDFVTPKAARFTSLAIQRRNFT